MFSSRNADKHPVLTETEEVTGYLVVTKTGELRLAPNQTGEGQEPDSGLSNRVETLELRSTTSEALVSDLQLSVAGIQTNLMTVTAIAEGKSVVLIQSAAPTSEFRDNKTLWIDTTGGANTPKRWSGTVWSAITDKAAVDAAAAAVAARTEADKANTAVAAVSARIDAEEASRATADAALGQRATTLETEVSAASVAASNAKTAADKAQADATKALGDAAAVKTTADAATTSITAAVARIATLEGDLLTAKNSITGLTNRVATLESEVAALKEPG